LTSLVSHWAHRAKSTRALALASVQNTVGLKTPDLRQGEAEVILEQFRVVLSEGRRRFLKLFGKGRKPKRKSWHVEFSYELIFDLGNRTTGPQVRMIDRLFHGQNRSMWYAMLFQKRQNDFVRRRVIDPFLDDSGEFLPILRAGGDIFEAGISG